MIKGTINIREKTLKDPNAWADDSQYKDDGFYKITDNMGDVVLICVYTPAYKGSIRIVTWFGKWEDFEPFFKEDEPVNTNMMGVKEVTHNAGPVYEGSAKGNVSESFALDMLSIAMHGKKAE